MSYRRLNVRQQTKVSTPQDKALNHLRSRKRDEIYFQLRDTIIKSSGHLTDLVICLDDKRIYNAYIEKVSQETDKVAAVFGRLMPNIKGPNSSKN